MTTIVYRDGIMAADSRAYSGDRRPIGFKNKITRLEDGTLFAATSVRPGNSDIIRRLFAEHGPDKTFSEEVDVAAIAVRPNGEVWYYSGGKSFAGPLMADYYAIGSGEDYAMGAMAMGASAEQAVRIAMVHDVYSDGDIQILRLGGESGR